jgi:hypothetical protein
VRAVPTAPHWMKARIAAAALLAVLCLGLAQSAAPAKADDAVKLGVTTSATDAVELTVDELRAMGDTSFATGTPWTKGTQKFEGITGAQIVAAMQAKGQKLDAKSVLAVANNDYSIVIPFEVFNQPTTLVAFAQNGGAMPVRDKGPFWIVFPYDQDAKFLSSSYQSYSIWGLERLDFQAQ